MNIIHVSCHDKFAFEFFEHQRSFLDKFDLLGSFGNEFLRFMGQLGPTLQLSDLAVA